MEGVVRGTWVIAYRELLRFFRERTRIVSSFAMPLIFLVIFGEGLSRSMGNLTPGIDFIQFMYPGIIAMTVFMNSIGSGISVVWDREFGFLKEVLVAPLAPSGIVFGKALGGTTVALMQGLVMLALAPAVGVSISFTLVLKLVPLLVVLALTLSGFGLIIASRMRSQQSFQLVFQVIVFPLNFLSGIFFPVNNVPTWMEVISKLNPLTYGVDAIRRLFLAGRIGGHELPGGSPLIGVRVFGHTTTGLEDIAVVAVIGLLLLTVATLSFGRQD